MNTEMKPMLNNAFPQTFDVFEGARVLLMGADPGAGRAYSKLLRKSGFDPLSARDESEMFDLVEREQVDLILLDQHLPGRLRKPGLQRLCSRFPTPPVVMMGDLNLCETVDFLRVGGVDFLPKPVDSMMLKNTLRRALSGKNKALPVRAAGLKNPSKEETEKFKTDFIANVSHEFRLPLQGIMGYSDLALAQHRAGQWDEEKALAYFKGISRNARHLSEIVNNLLELAKLDAGVAEMDPELVDLGELFAELARDCQARLKPEQHLKLLPPPPGAQVLADRQLLYHVLLNLLDNAIKYAPQGDIRLIGVVSKSGRVTLMVDDQGPGIDPFDQEAIFEKFVRLRHRADVPGTGLGLPITERLVRILGSRIRLNSCPGKGACFFFHLEASP